MTASIVARARFIEDLVVEQGVAQYVILGAGLDTFVQRHVSAADLAQRYFARRTDGLRPPNNSEELLVART